MVIVDASYKFVVVHIGHKGRASDASVYLKLYIWKCVAHEWWDFALSTAHLCRQEAIQLLPIKNQARLRECFW